MSKASDRTDQDTGPVTPRGVDRLAVAEELARTLSSVFESMADGFFLLDADWRFLYVNARGEYLLRRKRAELLGRVLWAVFTEATGTVFETQFRKAMTKREPVYFEEYYAPHDMWASVHVLPTEMGLSVYLSDITSQKVTEAALAQSEGQLRAFIDNSPAVVYIKDVEGSFLRVNEEFARRFGKSKEEVVGKTDSDLLDGENARDVRKHDSVVLRTEAAAQFEEEIRLPDGQTIVYLSTKFPLKDTSGRVYAIAGISTNINDRIRQARKLAASEQRFRKVFQEGPLGIALLDPSLVVAQVNDRYAVMLGYSKAELTGMTLFEVTDDEDMHRAQELALQLLRAEVPSYRLEQRFRRADGTCFWASVHGTLLRDEAGRPEYVMSLVEDITQRKAAEDALRDKDRQVREAYSEALSAITGGKIVLLTPAEIEDTLGTPIGEPWSVSDYANLATIRHALARVLLETGMNGELIDSYVLAACEAFTNAVKHAGGGKVAVHRRDDVIQICVSDQGPGIDFEHLPRATLLAGFSTAQSLGAGFTIMLELCDRLLLSTQRGLTVIVLEGSFVGATTAEPAHAHAAASTPSTYAS